MAMSDEMPPEVLTVLKKLWLDDSLLRIRVYPRDAWTAVAVIQFATRNPQLSETQRDAAIRVGREIQEALVMRSPDAASYLEDGWNPENDVPR
jgi:hypothetical protein